MKKIISIAAMLIANLYCGDKTANATVSLHLLAIPKVEQSLLSPASQKSPLTPSPSSTTTPLSPATSPDSPVNASTTVDKDSGLKIVITTTEKKETK